MTAEIIGNLPFIVSVLMIMVGLSALLFKKNMIKMAVGLSVMGSGINIFLVATCYRFGSIAPIFTNAPLSEASKAAVEMALPVPQSLTLTSIVISLAVTALMLSLAMLAYRHSGTLDSEKSRRLKG
ncbi:MAG: cation:proton antiporter subunit C [Candidatus Diapherotrites archaeon]|nr:cation:proton antiporter subunit C [Candidatus Diapherotrites archaeon]